MKYPIKKQKKTLYVVDDNGEIVETLPNDSVYVRLEMGDRVLRKNSLDSYEEMTKIPMRFLKINHKVFGEVCLKYPLLLYLLDNIQYQSGRLVYRNGRSIRRKDLAKLCGLSPATIDRQLKGLMRDDIIKSVKEDGTVVYYVNPFVLHSGRQIFTSSFDLFKNSIYRESYEELL